MASRKTVLMNQFAGQQWKQSHREETLDTGRGKGKHGMNRDSSVETYILPHAERQWEFTA